MFRAQLPGEVSLQILEERHAPQLFAAVDRNREYLREWLAWVDATESEDDILSFIRSSLEQFADNKGFAAGIWSGKALCGTIGTHKLDLINQKGEIGYWLANGYQGRGIMTAACRALVTHLLVDRQMNRVEIHCAKGNQKSAAVAIRLGFTEEGTAREAQRLHGEFHDTRRFAMLRTDWKP